MATGRPGQGGRRRRRPKGAAGAVVDDLERRFGDPFVTHSDSRHELRAWVMDRDGDGVLCARMSSADISGGETPQLHIDPVLEMLEREGRTPYALTMVLRGDRGVEYEDRLDFHFLEALHMSRPEKVKWCAWRSPDRVGRYTRTVNAFYHWLRQSGIELLFDRKGLVDWQRDKTEILFEGVVAELHADQIRTLTTAGLRRRLLEPGRPWPGAVVFGFRIGPEGYLEEDSEQFAIVRQVFELYLGLDADGTSRSTRSVSRLLAERGIPMSDRMISKTLKDERYVTGQQTTTYEGKEYETRPAALSDPIPREWHDAAALRLQTMGGKNTVTPHGLFCLNAVKLVHEPCMDRRDKNGIPIRLAAYLRRDTPDIGWEDTCYRHRSGICERPIFIMAPLLEETVIRALWQFADDADLQREWIAAARPDPREIIEDDLGAREATLASRLRNVNAEMQALLRDFQTDASEGRRPDKAGYARLVAALELEANRLEDQIRLLHRSRQQDAPARDEESTAAAAFREVLTLRPPDDPEARSRRVDLLRACVSRIIVHDLDGPGHEITIEGPIVPSDSPLRTFLPHDKARAKGSLASDFLPAWRSSRLPIERPASWPFRSVSPLLQALKEVHQTSGPGELLLVARQRKLVDPDLPLTSRMFWPFSVQTGLTDKQLAAAVAAPRELLILGRVREVTLAIVLEAIVLALETAQRDSYSAAKPWYRTARLREPCLPEWRTVRRCLERYGLNVEEVIRAVREGAFAESEEWQAARRQEESEFPVPSIDLRAHPELMLRPG